MAKRFSKSDRTLRFLHQAEFEELADLTLAEYGRECGQVTAPPVPIDEIVEGHPLKLVVEIRDLRAEYPEGDVLGAIYFDDRRIVVDQRLVPEDYPAMRGRYRFTVAHELGHWRLHRHRYLRRANAPSLLPGQPARPNHVLRSRPYDPEEVQANKFASCLLMPREMVKREWFGWRGSMEPIYLTDLRERQQQILGPVRVGRGGLTTSEEAITSALYDHAIRPFAERFEVSAEAMRYRLQELKLLQPKKLPTLFG